MNKKITVALGITTLFLANSAFATTVKTCSLDYSGVFNHVDVENGVVRGIAKIFAKSSTDDPFTLIADNGIEYQRHGTITTTVDLTDFANNGNACNIANRFTPIHSISENSPWRQFQMRFDSYYDSNIVSNYSHNGIQSKLMVANGWTWGTDMATIHVFEMINGEFFPVKYDVDQGNGELAPYMAGDYAMSTSGDGGQWQYRASAVSDDGRLVAGYAKLEESVNFDQGSSISDELKFGMVWEITDSCSANSGTCNNNDASRLTSGSENTPSLQARSISASQITRNSGEKASYARGQNVTIERDGLQQGQIITHDSIPTNFTFGYEFFTGVETVACTLISASGALDVNNKRERFEPYVIYGDHNAGQDYNTRNKSEIGEGELTLTITGYTDRNCTADTVFTDSVTITVNKTDSNEDPGTASEQTGDVTGQFYVVDRQELANNFEMLSYDPDNTMESIFGITTISPGKYIVNGRSHSGKAMVALVEL
ncbi:MAG: hypothetical protein GJ680_05630 [Alteromonadaceae bacterium]|nr:hypothetical protein [Alteromonadaceae bacterium]